MGAPQIKFRQATALDRRAGTEWLKTFAEFAALESGDTPPLPTELPKTNLWTVLQDALRVGLVLQHPKSRTPLVFLKPIAWSRVHPNDVIQEWQAWHSTQTGTNAP